jgi:hypothetical protein
MAIASHKQTTSRALTLRLTALTAAFWLLALGIAAIHTWYAIVNQSMNPDGIAYLDIGDAYMRGDWQTALNPVWSPLYPLIQGVVLAAVRPPMPWEFPLAQLVNLALFISTFLCFEFFWRQLNRYRQQGTRGDTQSWPDWAWFGLGYALFIWATLNLIAVWAVTPDMMMAGFVLLAAGLIVRMRMGHDGWRSFALLGLILGLGYLSKTIMFPLAFVFLAVALFTAAPLRRGLPRTLLALGVFFLISGPFIAAISVRQGGLTFGEAGTITYIRHVNNIPYPHWQGEGDYGTPLHPSRQIHDDPPIYEFAEPVGGTYPVGFNAAYWYEGAVVEFHLLRQLWAFVSNGLYLFNLFAWQLGGLSAAVLFLYLNGAVRRPGTLKRAMRPFFRRWGLLLIALAAFALYVPVLVQGRYIAVFVLLLWADLLANLRQPAASAERKLIQVASLLMIGFLLTNVFVANLEKNWGMAEVAGVEVREPLRRVTSDKVAASLWQLGVEPGDQVGVIGYAFDSYWARLARVKIVAEMFEWQAGDMWWDPARQQEVVQAFATTGVRAIVAEYVPASASLPGWRQVEGSAYYIYLLEDGQ